MNFTYLNMGKTVTRKKGRLAATKHNKILQNPCRVCQLSNVSYCQCSKVGRTELHPGRLDPKVADRDVYARLRTLIDAYEHHRNVDRFHCETVYDKDIYDLWVTKATELEGIL